MRGSKDIGGKREEKRNEERKYRHKKREKEGRKGEKRKDSAAVWFYLLLFLPDTQLPGHQPYTKRREEERRGVEVGTQERKRMRGSEVI